MTGKVVCVASTGGHLEQLHQMHTRLLETGQSAVWVTFDSPQSRSLLAGEDDVVFVRRVGSRAYLDLLRSVVPAWQVLRQVRPQQVYSTGAGIALAFLPLRLPRRRAGTLHRKCGTHRRAIAHRKAVATHAVGPVADAVPGVGRWTVAVRGLGVRRLRL